MAQHDIFLGGQRTPRGGFYEMLPSTAPKQNQEMTPTTHKDGGNYSLSRHLFWNRPTDCPSTGASEGSAALCDYLSRNEIVEGDILNIVIMSRQTSLLKIWWMIHKPLAGFTFDLQIQGTSQSLGGTEAAPAPIVLAEDVDAGLAPSDALGCNFPSGLIGIDPAAQGDPLAEGIYFDQNDMLQLVVKTLPDEGISCSELIISPVIETYCRGAY